MSNPSARAGAARLHLGAHMSISGGLHLAVDRALSVDATALQIFVKSARQWKSKPLSAEEIDAFRLRAQDGGLAQHTIAHASYLINLASPDASTWERSRNALGDELQRCARLGVPGLVLHPGSHVGSGESAGLSRVVAALRELLAPTARQSWQPPAVSGVAILLENTAGQGTNLGHRFEHLGRILHEVDVPERTGICFDTCHALAAGYEFRSPQAYRAMTGMLDSAAGLQRVRAIHLNDSKAAPGSRKDRHEHIGRGHVGLDGFRNLLNDSRFAGLPMVLETPKGEELDEDRRNLAALRELVPRGRR